MRELENSLVWFKHKQMSLHRKAGYSNPLGQLEQGSHSNYSEKIVFSANVLQQIDMQVRTVKSEHT